MSASAATTRVAVTVLGIAPVRGARPNRTRVGRGRLLALASVELVIDGVAITLQGVQIMLRGATHDLAVAAPVFRGPTLATLPAVILPDDLASAVADAVLDQYQAGAARSNLQQEVTHG